jgi:hypothetical protein
LEVAIYANKKNQEGIAVLLGFVYIGVLNYFKTTFRALSQNGMEFVYL